jgi:branched-chain amino acid transport system permease protein
VTSALSLTRSWPALVKWGALAVLVVILLFLPYMVDSFFIDIASQALLFGLFALSINLVSGYGGMVTLGQAALFGTAGYAFAILVTKYTVSLWPAFFLALVVTVVASAFFGLLASRARDVYFLMITLAEGMVVWGIAERWSSLTGGDNGITGVPRPEFALEYWTFYYFVLAVVALCTILIYCIVNSSFGLSLKGMRESESRMAPLGYNVVLHKVLAFTISGLFAGVGGLLLSMYNNFIAPPSVYVTQSAQGLLMSILGGIASLSGAFIGSTIVVTISNYVSSYIERWPTLLGVIFVVVILLAPDGITGAWTRRLWVPLLRRAGREREAEAAARTGTAPILAAVSRSASDAAARAGGNPAPEDAESTSSPAPHKGA